MSECATGEDFDVQLALLVVSLCFHVFEAFVTGMRWRMKCKNCMCSAKPKDCSPSPGSDSSSSPEKPSPVALTSVVVEHTNK